jgi:hypothetical protein
MLPLSLTARTALNRPQSKRTAPIFEIHRDDVEIRWERESRKDTVMANREEWRQPVHRHGDCVAQVPTEILQRYAGEGPDLERRGELPPVPAPRPDDFESRAAFEAFRSADAAP